MPVPGSSSAVEIFLEDDAATLVAAAEEAAEPHAGVAVAAPCAIAVTAAAAAETDDADMDRSHAVGHTLVEEAPAVVVPSVTENTLNQIRIQAVTVKI